MVDLDTDTTWALGAADREGFWQFGERLGKRVGGRRDGGSVSVLEGGYNNGGRLTA